MFAGLGIGPFARRRLNEASVFPFVLGVGLVRMCLRLWAQQASRKAKALWQAPLSVMTRDGHAEAFRHGLGKGVVDADAGAF